MKKWFKIAAVAAAFTMLASSMAYADVLYAPGIKSAGITGPGGPGAAVVAQVQETAAVEEAPQAPTAQQNTAPAESVQPAGAPVGQVEVAQTAYTGTGEAVVDPITGLIPQVHIQMLKTDGNLTDGFTTRTGVFNSPTDGFSGLKLRYENSIGDVYYRVYTDEHGWSKWAMNEMITPYIGDSAKVKAIQVRTKGHTRNLYDLYYQATLNDGTVLDWAHDGQTAGALGNDKYIQKLEFRLWRNGMAFNGKTQKPLDAAHGEGVYTGTDGKVHYSCFDGGSYTGWAYDSQNNKYYFENNETVSGWKYIDDYKYYFDESGKVVTDLEPIIGIPKDLQIRINKSMKCMTIMAKDPDKGTYTMPFKVILNTIGPDTPIGTFKTYEKYRWKFMHDDIYCQFLLRFKNGFLLHSIIYKEEPESHHLVAATYNYLGKNQSDGCVRMASGDAAWVYEHCGTGTTVTIYSGEWSTGPFDRPAIEQAIPFDQNYDPTDPVIVAKQKADAAAAQEAVAEMQTGVEARPTEIAQ